MPIFALDLAQAPQRLSHGPVLLRIVAVDASGGDLYAEAPAEWRAEGSRP